MKISERYNSYFEKMFHQCSTCFQKKTCGQCIFHLENLENIPECKGYMGVNEFGKYMVNMLTFFETHPDDYHRLINEVVIE
jgi:uncharacterized protein